MYRWSNSFGGCYSTAEHSTEMFDCNYLNISEASGVCILQNLLVLQTFNWEVLYRPWCFLFLFLFINTTILFISIAVLVPSTITEFEKYLKFNHLSFHLSESKLKTCGALGMFTGNLDNMFKEWNYENKQSEVFLRLQNPSLDWLDYESDLIWWKDESLFGLWKWGKTLTVQCYFSLIVWNSYSSKNRNVLSY